MTVVFNRRTWCFYFDTGHQKSNNQFLLHHACLIFDSIEMPNHTFKEPPLSSSSFNLARFHGCVVFRKHLIPETLVNKRKQQFYS